MMVEPSSKVIDLLDDSIKLFFDDDHPLRKITAEEIVQGLVTLDDLKELSDKTEVRFALSVMFRRVKLALKASEQKMLEGSDKGRSDSEEKADGLSRLVPSPSYLNLRSRVVPSFIPAELSSKFHVSKLVDLVIDHHLISPQNNIKFIDLSYNSLSDVDFPVIVSVCLAFENLSVVMLNNNRFHGYQGYELSSDADRKAKRDEFDNKLIELINHCSKNGKRGHVDISANPFASVERADFFNDEEKFSQEIARHLIWIPTNWVEAKGWMNISGKHSDEVYKAHGFYYMWKNAHASVFNIFS